MRDLTGNSIGSVFLVYACMDIVNIIVKKRQKMNYNINSKHPSLVINERCVFI